MSVDTGCGRSCISVRRNERDQLTSNLKELEDEVHEAVRQRSALKRSHDPHSLADNFTAESSLTARETQQSDEITENVPSNYLQRSNVGSRSQDRGRANAHVRFADEAKLEARRERYIDELARIENIYRNREAELREMDLLMDDRRRELEVVIYQRSENEARIRRATEEADTIERRMEETSCELKMADNQLKNLENKTKKLQGERAVIVKEHELKERQTYEIQRSCDVSRERLEILNKDLRNKSEELESKEKQLNDVESRLHLSLSLEKLKEAAETTEMEQKKKLSKCLDALKDGEVALEERAAQLARRKHEVQTLTVEYHEMSCKMTTAGAALRDLDTKIMKKKEEVEKITKEEESTRIYHQRIVEEANDKLGELNEIRNNTLTTLKAEREELAGLSRNITEYRTKIRELEDSRRKKQTELQTMSLNLDETKKELSNLKELIKKEEDQMKRLKSESEEEKFKLRSLLKEVEEVKEKHVETLRTKESLQNEVDALEAHVADLTRKKQLHDESAIQAFNEMQKQQNELLNMRQHIQQVSAQKEAAVKGTKDLEKNLEAKSSALCSVTSELDEVRRRLEVSGKELAGSRNLHDEIVEKIKQLNGELERMRREEEERREQGAALEKREGLAKLDQEIRDVDRSSSSYKAVDESESKGDSRPMDQLQEYASNLKAEKETAEAELKNAKETIRELENQMKQERIDAQKYARQVTSKANVFQHQLEQIQMERNQEREETGGLFKQLKGYQLRERDISQELSRQIRENLEQKSQLESQEKSRAQDFESLKDQIQSLTSSTKAEVAKSLKEVEISREQAVEGLEQLQRKKNEMEVQITSLQMSMSSVNKRHLKMEEDKVESSKHEKEEARRKEAKQDVERHQSYLKEQIRQQMSRRAVVLEEEQRKAKTSLEGLKTKLTTLEQVISRKDSGVGEFRLELLKSRIEKEKSLDTERELEDMKRKLRAMDEERGVILGQRNHLIMLNEERLLFNDERKTLPLSSDQEMRRLVSLVRTPDSLRRSLDSTLTRTSNAPRFSKSVLSEQYAGARDDLPRNVSADLHRSDCSTMQYVNGRLEVDYVPRRLHHEVKTGDVATSNGMSSQVRHDIRKSDTDVSCTESSICPADSSNGRSQTKLDTSDGKRELRDFSMRVPKSQRSRTDQLHVEDAPCVENRSILPVSAADYMELVQSETSTLKRPIKGTRSSGRMSLTELVVQGTTKATRRKADQSSVPFSASTVVENNRTMFLASVNRLKNEKLKELEYGLQKTFGS